MRVSGALKTDAKFSSCGSTQPVEVDGEGWGTHRHSACGKHFERGAASSNTESLTWWCGWSTTVSTKPALMACVGVSLLWFRGFGGLLSVRRSWSSECFSLAARHRPQSGGGIPEHGAVSLEAPVLFWAAAFRLVLGGGDRLADTQRQSLLLAPPLWEFEWILKYVQKRSGFFLFFLGGRPVLEGYFNKSGFDCPCLHRESQRELCNVLKKSQRDGGAGGSDSLRAF